MPSRILPQLAPIDLAEKIVSAPFPFRSYAKVLKDLSPIGADLALQGNAVGANLSIANNLGPVFKAATSSHWYRGAATGEPGLQHSGAWTVAIWVKANTLAMANDGYFWTYRNYGSHYPINFYMTKTTGVINFGIYSGGALKALATTETIAAGQWYHLAAVYKPSTFMGIYLNGRLSASTTTTVPASIDTWTDIAINIGSPGNDTFSWDGWLAHPYAWTRALELGDIRRLWADPMVLFRHPVKTVIAPQFLPRIIDRRYAFNRQPPPKVVGW